MFLHNQLTSESRSLSTQKHSILNVWKGSEYVCAQIASGIVLCHHNKHLMGYFQFLHGSRVICVPLNISEKWNWQLFSEKLEETETVAFIWRRPPFLHSDTNLVLGHVLVYSADKTHVLVVTVDLIWLFFLNIHSFNFVPTPDKSLKFTGLRRSYVNQPAFALIKVTLLFCVMCIVQRAMFLFCCFFRNYSSFVWSIFFKYTCCSNVVNSKVTEQAKRCQIVIHKYIKTNCWSFKHSISRRAKFSPNSYKVEQVKLFSLLCTFI